MKVNMKVKPTIIDVAQRAGVSPSTVTHAMNGKRPVSLETKKRINKAIDSLGYVASYSASHLRTSHSGLIGCYVADITADFTSLMLRGVENAIKGTGYSLIFASGMDIGSDTDIITNYFRRYNVDGLLILNHLSSTSGLLADNRIANFPIVFLNTENKHYDSIIPDNQRAGELVAQHLFDCGVRKPVFLGGAKTRISVQKRLIGFKNRMSSLGVLLPENYILFGDFTYEAGYDMASALFERNTDFDGLFCANDYIGVGAIKRCLEAGRTIPSDLKVVGFDDRDVGKYCNIPLTTVKQNLEDIGTIGFERLLSKIKNSTTSHGVFYSTPELVVRASSEFTNIQSSTK